MLAARLLVLLRRQREGLLELLALPTMQQVALPLALAAQLRIPPVLLLLLLAPRVLLQQAVQLAAQLLQAALRHLALPRVAPQTMQLGLLEQQQPDRAAMPLGAAPAAAPAATMLPTLARQQRGRLALPAAAGVPGVVVAAAAAARHLAAALLAPQVLAAMAQRAVHTPRAAPLLTRLQASRSGTTSYWRAWPLQAPPSQSS